MPIQKKRPADSPRPEDKYTPQQDALFEEESSDDAQRNLVQPKLRSGMESLQQAIKDRESSGGGSDRNFRFTPDAQIVLFLSDGPVHTYSQHWVPNAEGKDRPYTCSMQDMGSCPLCDAGIRARFCADFLVLTLASQDDSWVEKRQVMTVGIQAAEILVALDGDDRKGPLQGHWYGVYRTGKGRSTQHHFDFIKKRDLEEDWDIPLSAVDELEKENVGQTEWYTPWKIDPEGLQEAAKTVKTSL